LPDLIEPTVYYDCHGLIEYQTETEFVFLVGEAVVEYFHK